jgi:FG-GAP-like repeat/FG-GAP repeat
MSAAAFGRTAIRAAAATLVAVFVTSAAGARSANPSFAPTGLIPSGGYVCSFALARLDGDENLDIAATNCSTDTVTVLLSNGAGRFRRAATPVKARDFPNAIGSADFNGDGKADLAVGNDQSKDITILLGDGAGGFTGAPGSPIKYGRSPGRLTSADLNRDGHADLVVPGYPSRLAILLGGGSGRFTTAPNSPFTVPGRYGPRADVADFNADGKLDVAASTVDPMMIAILFGNGAGGFRPGTTIRAGLKDVADFNGDGRPDLAVATKGSNRAPYSAKVLLGTASGRFSPARGLRVPGQFWSTEGVAGDFGGDRKLDLALSDDAGRLSLLAGDGRGHFRPAVDAQLPLPAWSAGGHDLAAADVNRDGWLDLVVATRRLPERGGDSGLAVLWRLPSGPRMVARNFPGSRDAVFSTREPIWRLAADGARAAVVTGRSPCGRIRVVVWRATSRRSRSIEDSCLGDEVAQLALGGGQVAWLVQGGGNDLELSVSAARVSGGKARDVEFTTNGNRAGGDPRGGWLGWLLGGGSILAYDRWTLTCDVPEGHGCDGLGTRLIVKSPSLVRIVGSRKVVVKRGRAAYGLAAIGGGRMAVDSGGTVNVLAANGRQVAAIAPVEDDPPRAVTLSRTRLGVLRTFTLDVYSPVSGKQVRSIPLGPAASLQLAGVNAQLALLRSPRRLVLVRLRDGKLLSLALRTKSHIDAKLTGAGLFYAYNIPRGRARGRIVFESTRKLLGRF